MSALLSATSAEDKRGVRSVKFVMKCFTAEKVVNLVVQVVNMSRA